MKLADIRLENGKLPSYAWPGGYPLSYLMNDCEVLCPDCANDPTNPVHEGGQADGWRIEGYDINYEDPSLFCAHCNKRIESAYAEDEVENPADEKENGQ
jgi:hypothetical protein